MKDLKFANHLVDLILQGEKTTTWRLFDDKDLRVGDKLSLINKESGEKFAEAEILFIEEKSLKDLEDSDFEGHEKYEDQNLMLENFRKYYGDQVSLETTVKIIKFKLL